MTFIVRPAVPDDQDALEALCMQLLTEQQARFANVYPSLPPEAAAAHYAADWAARLEQDPSCLVWLAMDHVPVGFCGAEVWTRAIGQPTAACFGEWLYVVPAARGRGISLALLGELVTACQARGISHIECQTVAGDRQWQRRGWAEVSRRWMRPVDALAADLERAARHMPAAEATP